MPEHRTGYLPNDRYGEFQQQIKATHARLHGLIKGLFKN